MSINNRDNKSKDIYKFDLSYNLWYSSDMNYVYDCDCFQIPTVNKKKIIAYKLSYVFELEHGNRK